MSKFGFRVLLLYIRLICVFTILQQVEVNDLETSMTLFNIASRHWPQSNAILLYKLVLSVQTWEQLQCQLM